MGGFDAHYAAVGAGVTTGTWVKIIGTSTCECAVAPISTPVADIPGICGIVTGSILPGYYGIEAGQSAVGDILKWWVEEICRGDQMAHAHLSVEVPLREDGDLNVLKVLSSLGVRTRIALRELRSESDLALEAMTDALVRMGRRTAVTPLIQKATEVAVRSQGVKEGQHI